jgi:error-prone DNA polymerase
VGLRDLWPRPCRADRSTVIRYRAKGALRDVGKALGLPEDLIKALSSQIWGLVRRGRHRCSNWPS